ncbi:hypothetical protein BCR44DRAFT_1442632, partial [Catenaria anguillulae PL171]
MLWMRVAKTQRARGWPTFEGLLTMVRLLALRCRLRRHSSSATVGQPLGLQPTRLVHMSPWHTRTSEAGRLHSQSSERAEAVAAVHSSHNMPIVPVATR